MTREGGTVTYQDDFVIVTSYAPCVRIRDSHGEVMPCEAHARTDNHETDR